MPAGTPYTRKWPDRLARRLTGVLVVLALVGTSAGWAGAVTGSEVEAAKARVAELEREIEAEEARLAALQADAGELAAKMSAAQGELERIRAEIEGIRTELDRTRTRYQTLRARIDDRAREVYMQGPAAGLEAIIGATSFADLSARLEFLDALSRTDADLVSETQNLEYELLEQERRQESLLARERAVVDDLRADRVELAGRLREQEAILDGIRAKRADAERIAQSLSRQFREQMAERFGGPVGDGPIKICPVGQPRAFGDDFGAPRYGGGYHPHAGNDIFAPEGTPIYAPFDGYAFASPNTLGGLAVIVRGSEGWVYNAHLSRYGTLGDVRTGDVIGYVGATGNTSTPHNHFEWHPNLIPSDWPASGYGYSVVGDAINPRPLLLQVC